jgi:hypothetical protein
MTKNLDKIKLNQGRGAVRGRGTVAGLGGNMI